MQIEVDTASILQWTGTAVVGICIFALKSIAAKVEAAFRLLDKINLWLVKNTAYPSDEKDSDSDGDS
ncbi:MAG: hypothetical protein RL755_58 [Pseudomonadota bacterium]|jgi:hypothetical protein